MAGLIGVAGFAEVANEIEDCFSDAHVLPRVVLAKVGLAHDEGQPKDIRHVFSPDTAQALGRENGKKEEKRWIIMKCPLHSVTGQVPLMTEGLPGDLPLAETGSNLGFPLLGHHRVAIHNGCACNPRGALFLLTCG